MNCPLLCIFFEHGQGEFNYSLYAVKIPSDPLSLPSEESLNSQIGNPTPLCPTFVFKLPSGMRCVQWGSDVYFLGGQTEDVFYLPESFIYNAAATTNNPDASTKTHALDASPSLKKATPMKTGKPEPMLLFVAYGKMYALSSPQLLLDISIVYFEVFDPNDDTWASLPPPPFTGEFLNMEHVVVNRKVYIMAGQYYTSNDFALHCFDLDKNEWISPNKLKCPALPLRYSIAGLVDDTVYGFSDDTMVAFGPVKDTNENADGEFFNRLVYFSPEDSVNYFEIRPMMVDTSSILIHLGNKRFCYVVSGNPPLCPQPKDFEDLQNDPRFRYISLTIFEAISDTMKFLHSAHFVSETPWDTGLAILRDCMFIPYYLKTGTCKFGAISEFHHPRDKAGIAGRVSLNILGYPLHPNESDCSYYLRTGQCKFGSTCKFHHPQPANMMVSLRGSPVYPTVHSPTTPDAMWQMNLRSSETIESGPYPERPGEPDCSYYIRTGLCGFGAICRFNHPPKRKLAIATARMKGEFPERIGQPECQYYLKTGTCKFGATCKFHHPRDKAGIAGRVSFNI